MCRYCEHFYDLSVVLTGEFHEQQQPEVINPFENGYREEEREVEGGTHAYHVTCQGFTGQEEPLNRRNLLTISRG